MIYNVSLWKTGKKALLAFGLGLIGAAAFAPWFCRPALLIALAGLMFLLNGAVSRKQSALIGFSFGFGIGTVSLAWISNALLVDGGTFALLIPVVISGMGLLMGVFFMMPALLAYQARPGMARWLAFAAGMVLFEWIRSWFLTGFPWNLIGSIWTNCPPLMQFAAVFGVYGLSGLTILTFTAPGLLPAKKPLILSVILTACIYGGGWLRLYQAIPENVFGVNLRLVQPNIAQTLKWNAQKAADNMDQLIRLSHADNGNITHVIWPESAVPYLLEINTGERMRLMSAVRQGGTLITGALRVVNQEKRQLANSIFLINDLADITGYADKSHLVPFGEYVPLRGILPFDKIVPINSDFIAGNGPQTHHIPKAPPASLLVCYEIIFPHAVTETKYRPEWIVNVTNDGWYGNSAGPHQHLGMAQLRAVEEGLPVIRAANTGISAVIDPYGRILKSLPYDRAGILDSPLPRALSKTIYAAYGNYPLLILCFLCLLIVTFRRKK